MDLEDCALCTDCTANYLKIPSVWKKTQNQVMEVLTYLCKGISKKRNE